MNVIIPTEEGFGHVCISVESLFNDVKTLHQLSEEEKRVIRKLITSGKFPGIVIILTINTPQFLNSQSSTCLMAEVLLRSFGSFASLGVEIERNGPDVDFDINEVHLCEKLGSHCIEVCRRDGRQVDTKKVVKNVYKQIENLLEQRFATDAIFQKFYGKK